MFHESTPTDRWGIFVIQIGIWYKHLMQFRSTSTETFYEVTSAEKAQLTSWFDAVLARCEPEDVTGEFCITNFTDEDKILSAPGGTVVATKRRIAYERYQQPDDLTDVAISGGEIWEANASKGIYLYAGNPTQPDIIETTYQAELRSDVSLDPRYSGRVNVTAIPPHYDCADYNINVGLGLWREVDTRERAKTGADHVRYAIKAEESRVTAAIAYDPLDITGGQVRLRPFDAETAANNGFERHMRMIGGVVGLELPDFLR